MPKPFLAAILCAVVMAVSTGCCIDRVYQPSQCNDNWDSVLGSCTECGSCGGTCEGHTPCQAMKHSLTCGAGCGEIYWGEWTSDPPDDCDPCDNCGNWVGPQCCAPAWWESFKSGLSGWRYGSDGCCDSGTSHTMYDGYEGPYESSGEIIEGETVHGESIQQGPTLAPGNGVMQETVPAPNGSPKAQESIRKEPRPAAEPMRNNQTHHRVSPQRAAPQLLAPSRPQPHTQRHPNSVLAKSSKSAQGRGAVIARQAPRPAQPQVRQASRYE